MIRIAESAAWGEPLPGAEPRPAAPELPRGLSFACASTDGAGGWQIEALLRTADGQREELRLDSALSAAEALERLGARPLIVPERGPFLAAWRALGARAPGPCLLALDELTALFAGPARPAPASPAALALALAERVDGVLAQPPAALALILHALESARRALAREGHAGARELGLLLGLLEHPSAWLEPGAQPVDGRLTAAARELDSLAAALDLARPRWRHDSEERAPQPPALRVSDERTLDELDRAAVARIFEEHAPARFGGSYRLGQEGVAASLAESFGRRELRLVHAPTGTGKTLAYLVPVALWALRNHARVGVATFTRVLQDQAMAKDVPLALELLARHAGADGVRVSALKGRNNYLCWRALCLQARSGDDPADEAMAWAQLALFALADAEGDLDHFTPRAPLGSLEPERHRRALERLLRAVRSETGCCSLAADRATCGAESALRRAERAHVVVTNHALALARRDFFQHLVFDECEHLHEVALNAFSSAVKLSELDGLLARLAGDDGRRPLERVAALAAPDSDAARFAEEGCLAVTAARSALRDLAVQTRAFKAWRDERARERQETDLHSLFREYVLVRGDALLAAHGTLCAALTALATALAALAETFEGALPPREIPRLRRALEVLRLELEEELGGVVAWIPRGERGAPTFGSEAFHDLETTASGEDVLVTRVLLPHEYLGRRYYPELAGAVLISATTFLRGGFAAASAYLGLARAASPAEDEERPPVPLHTFRAPEAFDYSRVLVAVPRDTPPVQDKGAWLAYCARFLAHLGERTRGRLLALFTNAEDVAAVGAELAPFFAARGIPFWWQGMRGLTKEELGGLFRARVDSVLLGLDAYWYGADFPGETLEYLVLARLPYGVPDRYYHAQCAAMGAGEQRRTIYLPRALAKFRQGFGRLMRRESDRGCVFVLDRRVLDPRHRAFLQELPLASALEREGGAEDARRRAHLVQGDTTRCLRAVGAHMGLEEELARRGLDLAFEGGGAAPGAPADAPE